MKFWAMGTGVVVTLAAGFAIWIAHSPAEFDAEPTAGTALVEIAMPDTLTDRAELGKIAFEAKCASCHGTNAVGHAGVAPPLIHKIYEPSHHGDESFQHAAAQGVRAHHWPFGDMPAVSGLTRADVDMIVAYIREVQRANGIN